VDACSGCGLKIDGGDVACQQLFDEFRVREAAHLAPAYAATRLTVDVYCLQHPDRYCVSAKSLAAHLTGLAWALEHGGSDAGLRALQRWLNGRVDITKPSIPAARGDVTIGEVHTVTGRDEYLAAVDPWARSTWAAYSSLHAIAEQWIDMAVGQA
jgi:hypothetical protein